MRKASPPPTTTEESRHWLSLKDFISVSDENAERFVRVMDWAKEILHYGWLPLILALGYFRSDPRPSIFRILNPLS